MAGQNIGKSTMTKADIVEKVYQKTGANIPDFLKKCAELNNVDDPEAELNKWGLSSQP